MKLSNLIIYCISLILLMFVLTNKTIDNNTYVICVCIMINAYMISTEIKDKKL